MVLVLCGVYLLVFLAALFYITRPDHGEAAAMEHKEDTLDGDEEALSESRMTVKIKIMISYVQIISSTYITFQAVPWPVTFTQFSKEASVVNLDFIQTFAGASCSLDAGFLTEFGIHMAMPLLMVLPIGVAVCLAWCIPGLQHRFRFTRTSVQIACTKGCHSLPF
jgi:hypothetical protein